MEHEASVTVVQPQNVMAELEALERRFAPSTPWVLSHAGVFAAFTLIGVLLAVYAHLSVPFLGGAAGFVTATMLFWGQGLFLGSAYVIVVRGGKVSTAGPRENFWGRCLGADFAIDVVAPGVFRGARIDLVGSLQTHWDWLDIHDDGTLVARRTLDGRKVHARTLRELIDMMISDMHGGRAA